MPPYGEWFTGRAAVRGFYLAYPLQAGRRWTCRIDSANGQPAIVEHVWDEEVGAFLAHNLTVLSFDDDGRILALDSFLDPLVVS
jgi:RNA polymerase sigma-70 factor (ECF subfamily)